MSTVFDVYGVVVDGGPSTDLQSNIESVNVSVENGYDEVSVEQVEEINTVFIEVPGLQGAPGDQMVYAQQTDPAVQYNWGPEDAGKIWIEVNV